MRRPVSKAAFRANFLIPVWPLADCETQGEHMCAWPGITATIVFAASLASQHDRNRKQTCLWPCSGTLDSAPVSESDQTGV